MTTSASPPIGSIKRSRINNTIEIQTPNKTIFFIKDEMDSLEDIFYSKIILILFTIYEIIISYCSTDIQGILS